MVDCTQSTGIIVEEEDEYIETGMEDNLELLGDDEMNPDDIPVSYHNALVFNETYQNHLHGILETLYSSLRTNHDRQEELEREIYELEEGRSLDNDRGGSADPNFSSLKLLPTNPLAFSARKATMCIFAAPYFKVNTRKEPRTYISIM